MLWLKFAESFSRIGRGRKKLEISRVHCVCPPMTSSGMTSPSDIGIERAWSKLYDGEVSERSNYLHSPDFIRRAKSILGFLGRSGGSGVAGLSGIGGGGGLSGNCGVGGLSGISGRAGSRRGRLMTNVLIRDPRTVWSKFLCVKFQFLALVWSETDWRCPRIPGLINNPSVGIIHESL